MGVQRAAPKPPVVGGWWRCVQAVEEARRALEAERAAQLSHMEGTREAAAAEKAALAKRYQVIRGDHQPHLPLPCP